MPSELRVIGVPGLPEIEPGADLAQLITSAIQDASLSLAAGDVLAVTHKIVSKAEGRVVRLADVHPSQLARRWAAAAGKDPRLIELALAESTRIVRMTRGVLIAETTHGFICANAGVDASNVEQGLAVLLPAAPDVSAARLRDRLSTTLDVKVGVIVTDTFGRPWREGQINVAIGIAGLEPLTDYRGQTDTFGRVMQASVIAIADEIASAAELVMRKTAGIPVAIVRGAPVVAGKGIGRDLLRPAAEDLFR
jgi:coenzyme F420-0:L-glutamate ligase/coenzyme F420-1:gamma-L-glutamate ligase